VVPMTAPRSAEAHAKEYLGLIGETDRQSELAPLLATRFRLCAREREERMRERAAQIADQYERLPGAQADSGARIAKAIRALEIG